MQMPPGVARPAVKGKTPRARCHVKTLYGALRANFARDSVPLVVGPRPRGRADDALSPPERTLDAADARTRARGPFHVRARESALPRDLETPPRTRPRGTRHVAHKPLGSRFPRELRHDATRARAVRLGQPRAEDAREEPRGCSHLTNHPRLDVRQHVQDHRAHARLARHLDQVQV